MLYSKFCIVLLIDCIVLILLVEILCHSSHKFCAILIIKSCEENKAVIVTTI